MLSFSPPEDRMVSQINVFHSAVELTSVRDAILSVTFVVRAPAVWVGLFFFFWSLSRSLVKIRLVLHSAQQRLSGHQTHEAWIDPILPPFFDFQAMKTLFTNISKRKTGSSFDCFAWLSFCDFCFVCNCHSGWQGVCFPFGNCEVTNRDVVYCEDVCCREDVCCWLPETTQI